MKLSKVTMGSIESLVFALLFSVLGCVSYPLGLSQQQWEALTPAKQAEFRAKQYQIDADNRARAEEARRQAAERKAERLRLETERLRHAYANAQYRDVVTVSVQGGTHASAKKNFRYEPVAFDLIKGETKIVVFRVQGVHAFESSYVVRLSEDGNTVFFNDESSERFVFVNRNWDRGETYSPSSSKYTDSVGLSGMTFFIKFKPISENTSRIIIEHR